MNSIQKCIFPSTGVCSEEQLYFKIVGNGFFSYSKKRIFAESSSKIQFDTYYNGLSLSLINSKTIIDELFLSINVKGKAFIKLGVYQLGKPLKWLSENEINQENQKLKVNKSLLDNFTEGILFFEICAISDIEFLGFEWQTDIEPARDVKLAVVITHFNNLNYVLPAIDRLKSTILNEHIKLFVIDNSRNIDISNSDHVTIIKNKNFGGSGGFARGLLEAKKRGFTHCLFMDDDASCETESIYRTFMIFSYAKHDNTAIAGSLLRELEPYRLFEKGAKFDNYCKPLCSGKNLKKVNSLLKAELLTEKVDYGGWWFFGYKIDEVEFYPFPFFVKGDDIMFSMMNKFDIATPMGVACWGEDFSHKASPLSIYLDLRNHIVQKMTHMNQNFLSVFKLMAHMFANPLFSYNYATAKSVIKAIQDIENDYRENDNFWIDNIDTKKIRDEISSFTPSEKLKPIEKTAFKPKNYKKNERLFRKALRFVTMNGSLLPIFFFKNKTALQNKGYRGVFRNIFRYKRVLYYYKQEKIGYIASFKRSEFFKCLLSFISVSIIFFLRFNKIKKKQKQNVSNYTRLEFWEKLYEESQ